MSIYSSIQDVYLGLKRTLLFALFENVYTRLLVRLSESLLEAENLNLVMSGQCFELGGGMLEGKELVLL